MTTGTKLIKLERLRVIYEEGITVEKDKAHTEGQLLEAALAYACAAQMLIVCEERGTPLKEAPEPPHNWPWDAAIWQPGIDATRCLEKAGALVAADLDRITGNAVGVQLITSERLRQIVEEGWTPGHDSKHAGGELVAAAGCYIGAALSVLRHGENGAFPEKPAGWPWEAVWWRPSSDGVRNREKAGALIASELDRRLGIGLTREALPPPPIHKVQPPHKS